MPLRLIRILLYALPVLLVTFAVVMGAYLVADAAGDAWGAATLKWCGAACAILAVINLVLLVGSLALHALQEPPAQDEEDSPPE